MSQTLTKASHRLIEAIKGSTFLTRSMVSSERIIDHFVTGGDAVILSRNEMRLLLERFTQELLTEQMRILDERDDSS